jgi:hypothetical protein
VGTGAHHRDRVLDLERLRWVDVFNVQVAFFGALPLDIDGLVLVTDQNVTGALEEDIGSLTPGTGPGLDVVGDQLGDVVESELRILAAVALGGIRRQQVPLGRP